MIEIRTDHIDIDAVHHFLSTESYWAKDIPRDVVARAIEHSLSFGAFDGQKQIGFARVITDRATFAYLADVYVLNTHRGRGIGRQLMEAVMNHPEVQGLRRWHLVTRDAHALYAQFGFAPLEAPERHMAIQVKNAYPPLTAGRM